MRWNKSIWSWLYIILDATEEAEAEDSLVDAESASVDPPSATASANFDAMAAHVRSNTSSTTPTMGSVVVMQIPIGTHSLFLLFSFPPRLLRDTGVIPVMVCAKSSCVGSIPSGAGT